MPKGTVQKIPCNLETIRVCLRYHQKTSFSKSLLKCSRMSKKRWICVSWIGWKIEESRPLTIFLTITLGRPSLMSYCVLNVNSY